MGDGTYSGGVTFGEYGPGAALPRAVTFNGTDGYMTLPTFTFSSAASVQSWTIWHLATAEITTATGGIGVISSTSASPVYSPLVLGAGTGLLTNEVVGTFSEALGTNDRTGWRSFTIPAGWNFHALTFNGSQNGWSYYLNGVFYSDKIASSGGSGGYSNATTYLLASIANTSYYNITVAGLAIFNRELPQTAIQRMYVAGKAGFEVGNGPRRIVDSH
jgi:hypothetical protein